MNLHLLILITALASVTTVHAEGTGPTLPERSREHPLDNREPRQDVIEDRGLQGKPPASEDALQKQSSKEEAHRMLRPETRNPVRDREP